MGGHEEHSRWGVGQEAAWLLRRIEMETLEVEELEFISNYDLKYRVGQKANLEEES